VTAGPKKLGTARQRLPAVPSSRGLVDCLERVLHCELQVAGAGRSVHHAFLAAAVDVDCVALHHEHWRVEGIDRFGAEFQALALGDGEVLGQPEVDLLQAGAALGGNAAGAEVSGTRSSHRARVEPDVARTVGILPVRSLARRSDAIGARLERAGARVAGETQHRNGEAAVDGEDGVHLPVTEDCVNNFVRVLSKGAIFAVGKLVGQVSVEYAGDVVVAESVILVDVVDVLLEGDIGAGLAGG